MFRRSLKVIGLFAALLVTGMSVSMGHAPSAMATATSPQGNVRLYFATAPHANPATVLRGQLASGSVSRSLASSIIQRVEARLIPQTRSFRYQNAPSSASKQEIVATARADTSWMELAIARSYQSALENTAATQAFDCPGGKPVISKGESLYESTWMCPVGYYTVDGVPVITGYYEWAVDMQLNGWQVANQALAVVGEDVLGNDDPNNQAFVDAGSFVSDISPYVKWGVVAPALVGPLSNIAFGWPKVYRKTAAGVTVYRNGVIDVPSTEYYVVGQTIIQLGSQSLMSPGATCYNNNPDFADGCLFRPGGIAN